METKPKERRDVDTELKKLYDNTRKALETYGSKTEVPDFKKGKLFLEDLVRRHPELVECN